MGFPSASTLCRRAPAAPRIPVAALGAALGLMVLAVPVQPAQAQGQAQPEDASKDALSKKLANPVSELISVPLQSNLDFGIGPRDATRSTTNLQPVVPVTLDRNWNLITRTILPIVYRQGIATGDDDRFGLGDTTVSAFLSPKTDAGGLIWGIGPAVLLPTGTDRTLGSRKWGAGPTGIVVKETGPWTMGLLGSHIWSFAGPDGGGKVDLTSVQPFVTRQLGGGLSVGITSETTYDWAARKWTVPINVSVSQIVHLGPLPVSLTAGPRFYAARPDGGPDWGLRFGATFLFPK